MTALYCTASDLYSYGIPRGAVANPGRLAESALASTNVVLLDVHGFDADDPVIFRAEAGGSLPAPLVEGTTYYAQPVSESGFKISATVGGAVLDLTTDGASVLVIAPLPIDKAIEWASRIVDDMLPAHAVPLSAPFPPLVVMTVAELAAGKLADRAGVTSKALSDILYAAAKRLARWAESLPVRGPDSPARANLSASAPFADSVGWGRWGGT